MMIPNSLAEAIKHGLVHADDIEIVPSEADRLVEAILPHVKAYLAERFCVIEIREGSIEDLWREIFPPHSVSTKTKQPLASV